MLYLQSHTGETNKRVINKFSRHLADLTIANGFLTTSSGRSCSSAF